MIFFSRVVLGIAWCCLVAAAKASTTPSTPSFGVCYYPEQWPDSTLETDCRNIAGSGIEFVRVGEFAWSVLEPSEGHFNWTVLDAALDQLYANQLKVVLGTPTATPPKWLVDKYPDVLPVAKDGTIRHFGSRRHYSFSSPSYLNQTVRFVTAMATRYGAHPAVAGWQLDNELGCHDTVQSFDDNAKLAFRTWLAQRYNTVDRLNAAWGNIFWSMDYGNFDEVDLPNLTVTEANPAQWLDWYRFSSDQLVAYAKVQADIIRRLSPSRFVTHNFMGFFFEFDSFALSKLLDFATWDSYPLGFTDTALGIGDIFTNEQKIRYSRTGAPDLAAFHHDLYRAVGNGTFWIMEQQPGPVNWGGHNPSPYPGMVRLWTWEAFAHGAAVVSYFRWRQAPFAQEKWHTGLNRRDNSPDVAMVEMKAVQEELKKVFGQTGRPASFSLSSSSSSPSTAPSLPPLSSNIASPQTPVAILFDFQAYWMFTIQPQGASWVYIKLVYSFYSTLRKLGFNVDFIDINDDTVAHDLTPYKLLVAPSLPFISDEAAQLLEAFNGTVVLGPRSAGQTADFQTVPCLAPQSGGSRTAPWGTQTKGGANGLGCSPAADVMKRMLPIRVVRSESFRDEFVETVSYSNLRTAMARERTTSASNSTSPSAFTASSTFAAGVWREWLEVGSAEDVDVSVIASYPGWMPYEPSSASACSAAVAVASQPLPPCSVTEAATAAAAAPTSFSAPVPLPGTAAAVHARSISSDRLVAYLSFYPPDDFLQAYLLDLVRWRNVSSSAAMLPEDVRISRRSDGVSVAVNYGAVPMELNVAPGLNNPQEAGPVFLVGEARIPAHGVAVFRCPDPTSMGEQPLGECVDDKTYYICGVCPSSPADGNGLSALQVTIFALVGSGVLAPLVYFFYHRNQEGEHLSDGYVQQK